MKWKLLIALLLGALLLTGCPPATSPCGGTPVFCALCDGWGNGCTCITNPSTFMVELLSAMTESADGVAYWLCGP